MRAGLTQRELAQKVGCEQGYVSATELGVKTPSVEYLAEFVVDLQVDDQVQAELAAALKMSKRRFVLPPDVSTETYIFCSKLWERLERLHPSVLTTMTQLLDLDDQLRTRPTAVPTQIRRNRKEASM